LLLAVIGVYAVLSYTVTQRRYEIGIRVAIGAQRRQVIGLVVGEGMVIALIALAIGLAASIAVARYLDEILFETRPLDPATYALMSLLVLGVVAAASYLPARRAARTDPIEILRLT